MRQKPRLKSIIRDWRRRVGKDPLAWLWGIKKPYAEDRRTDYHSSRRFKHLMHQNTSPLLLFGIFRVFLIILLLRIFVSDTY